MLAVLVMEFRGYQSTFATSLPPVADVPLFQRYDSLYRLLAKACPACSGSGKRAEPAAPAARWVIDLIGQQVAMSEGQHRLVMG